MSTCCAQHARREWREDCAGSGDSDEDEDVEALAGFFRLVVEMWGVFCGRPVPALGLARGPPRSQFIGRAARVREVERAESVWRVRRSPDMDDG